MSANIRESEIPDVVALLSDFAAVEKANIRRTLTDEEVDVIYQRRRDILKASLLNKGINLKTGDPAALSIVPSAGNG